MAYAEALSPFVDMDQNTSGVPESWRERWLRRKKEGGQEWVDFMNSLVSGMTTPLSLEGSPNYPPAVNFGLSGIDWTKRQLTRPVEQVKGAGKSIFDFMFTPENQQNLGQAAPAPQPQIDLTQFRRPDVGSAVGGDPSTSLFSMDAPSMPAPPQITPFLRSLPPQLTGAPPPPEQAAPDYSDFNTWIGQATPQEAQVDWKKQRLRNMFLGLSQGAAGWDPRTGLGGLVAAAGASGGAGIMRAREQEMAANDEYVKAMQDYARTRAQLALGMAKDEAGRKDTNASRKYNWEVGETNVRNTNTQNQFELEQANLKAVHEASLINAENMWKYVQQETERNSPKIVSATKDGVVVSRMEKGKQVLEHKSFGKTEGAHLKDLAEIYGEDSTQYKMAVAHDRLASGDYITVMKDIAKDAVEGGYAQQVFPDKYEEAKTAVMSEIGGDVGSKDYAERYNEAMARYLLQQVNMADPAMMEKFAGFGNTTAQYLLSGVKNGK